MARAIRIPEVHTVSPATLTAGTTHVLSVTGAHFRPDTTAAIAGGTGVTIDGVMYVSPTQLEVTITAAPDAPAGKRTLVVEVPGPGPGVGGRTGSAAYCPCLTLP